jgi:diguanylate cyclase (GGDEF)-like protein
VTAVALDRAALDAILPLSILFDAGGRVVHVGPTTAKVAPWLLGAPLSEGVAVTGPPMPSSAEGLLAMSGRRIKLALRPPAGGPVAGEAAAEAQRLRATVLPLPGGGGLIAAAFGPDIVEAVRRHGLSAADFGPTDLSVELLFLIEAQGAVLAESDGLISRIAAARDVARDEAQTDTLTGLRNRRAIEATLRRLVEPPRAEFGLMHLDLDRFKEVNDGLGHAAGDRVLGEVARVLRRHVREEDLLARLGGDEFLLVFDGCTDLDTLDAIAGRIIREIERPVPWEGRLCRVSASIGITASDLYARPDPARMIADADEALYASKRAGRARAARARPPGLPLGPPRAPHRGAGAARP